LFFFFFQAEDGIRDKLVTGVQTCALPILCSLSGKVVSRKVTVFPFLSMISAFAYSVNRLGQFSTSFAISQTRFSGALMTMKLSRSEERRVGKECRCRLRSEHLKER